MDVDEVLTEIPTVVPERAMPAVEADEEPEAVEQEQGSGELPAEPAAVIPEPEQPVSGSAVIGVNEMAVLLGRSTGTVREYLQQGRIPAAIQTGGRWTVNREAFKEWLKGKPAVMPTAKEVRAKHPPRPKWDNGDFRPPSDSLLNRQSEHTDFPTWGTTVPSGAANARPPGSRLRCRRLPAFNSA